MEVDINCHGFVQVPSGDELALKKAMASVGPISVCIEASKHLFQLYKEEVYDDQSCNSIVYDHAVLVVGYGVYQGKAGDEQASFQSTYLSDILYNRHGKVMAKSIER